MTTADIKNKFGKLFCLITFLLTCVHAQTQTQPQPRSNKIQLPIICNSLAAGYSAVSKYKEIPVFVAVDEQQQVEDLIVIVFMNKETKTFTISIVNKNSDLFCMILSGSDSYDTFGREQVK